MTSVQEQIFDVRGLRVAVTGAASGLGFAMAEVLADCGAHVTLADIDAQRLEGVTGSLVERGASARSFVLDVSDESQVEALIGDVVAAEGGIDVVFANAGFGAARGFLEETPEHWRAMVLTNVLGVAFTIRATLPHMLERGTGHYLVTSSIAGRRVLPGSLYSATKWAATAIGEALRQELRQMHENDAIKVTLIEPGMVDTPFFDNKPTGALEADDIAAAIAYAVSQPDRVDVNEILIRPISQSS